MSLRGRPTALLFDWDNTLAENWGAIQAAANACFDAFGMPLWDREETLRRVRGSMRDSFPALFGESDWPRARDLFYSVFEAGHLKFLKPLPGAERLLDAARERGVPCAVVSNKRGDYLLREIAHLAWGGHFRAAIGAGDAARDKPAPDPALMALQALAMPAGPRVWFVGDTETDVDCAAAAGLTAILIDGTPGVPERPGAIRLRDLDAVLAALATGED